MSDEPPFEEEAPHSSTFLEGHYEEGPHKKKKQKNGHIPLPTEKTKQKEARFVESGFRSNEEISRTRRRRRKNVEHVQPDPQSSKRKKKKLNQNGQVDFSKIQDIGAVYNYIERRELIGDEPNELPLLGGVYSAEMLKYSTASAFDDGGETEFEDGRGKLKLPEDGGIFIDGIPFHHFVLTELKPKHLHRLRINGITISNRHFSNAEDQQILRNWREFALLHGLDGEEEAERFVSAATVNEAKEEHGERCKLIKETNFRPFMCKRLLNRTCSQVFRRCYYLFRKNDESKYEERSWTNEEDSQLIDLLSKLGKKWEKIGTILNRTRFSCLRRYKQLIETGQIEDLQLDNEEEEVDQDIEEIILKKWNDVEISKLYKYLCDRTKHHPVIIALKPKYERDLRKINWEDSEMKLPHRTPEEKQNKWEELAQEFREASERLNTTLIKDLERAVLPADYINLLSAKTFKAHIKIHPEILSKCAQILAEDADFRFKLRDIDQEKFTNRLKEDGILDQIRNVSDPERRILRRIKWIEFLCEKHYCFQRIPSGYDALKVRLELMAYLLGRMDNYKIRKKKLWRRVKRFIRNQGWEPRKIPILVDKSIHHFSDNEQEDEIENPNNEEESRGLEEFGSSLQKEHKRKKRKRKRTDTDNAEEDNTQYEEVPPESPSLSHTEREYSVEKNELQKKRSNKKKKRKEQDEF